MEQKEKKHCPKCGSSDKQIWYGYNRSGTKRARCCNCNIHYTPNPKENAYTEEEKKQALKVYFSGASGRAVGRLLGMSKANVYRWVREEAKKNSNDKTDVLEPEKLWYFTNRKNPVKTNDGEAFSPSTSELLCEDKDQLKI